MTTQPTHTPTTPAQHAHPLHDAAMEKAFKDYPPSATPRTPTVAEAIEFARDLPADCHADRCIIVLAAELARLRAELALCRDASEALVGSLRTEAAAATSNALRHMDRAEKAEQKLSANNSLLVGQRNTAEAELVEARANESLFREALENLANLCEGRELFPNACAAARRAVLLAKPSEGGDAE